MTFEVSSSEFLDILRMNVVSQSHREAIFQKSTHTYKGNVGTADFRLKEVHKLFDNTRNDARIRGKVQESETGSKVNIETFGMAGKNIGFLLSGIFFLIVLPLTLEKEIGLYLHSFIAYFIPLFFIIGSVVWSRNAAGKMLTQFEREFFYMVEKNRKR